MKNIATVRITEVASQFAKNGFEVIGFSSNNYKFEGSDRFSLHPSIKIIRRNSWDLLELRSRLKKPIMEGGAKQTGGTAAGSGGRLSRLFSFLANYLPFSLVFGPGNIFYITRTVFSCLPYIKNDTIIFSSFRPYSDHIIAYLIKRLRPGVIWICDFRDPHLPPNSRSLFFRFHSWVNKRICRRATVVTTVSNGVAQNLAGYNKKIKVLRNGIVGSLNTNPVRQSGETFSIIYTGGLYGGARNPSVLFEALAALIKEGKMHPGDVKMIYAGPDKAIWDGFVRKYDLTELNESYNMLSHQASRELQDKASVNLLLTWADRNNKGVLTGKMYEYFKAAKPVITIISGDRDKELEEIMNETGAGPVIYSEGESSPVLTDFLLKLYKAHKEGIGIFSINEAALAQFQWDVAFPVFLQDLDLKKQEIPATYAL